MRSLWLSESKDFHDYHSFTANSLDNGLYEAFMSQSRDNLSVIIITFDNFKAYFKLEFEICNH